MNKLIISPSDIATAQWSWEDFYKKCVLGQREPSNANMSWGNFCHEYLARSKEERADSKFAVLPQFKAYMDTMADYLAENRYQPEVAYKRHFLVDDTEVELNYRLDWVHEITGKTIEMKFPQTAWTQGKLNGDVKTLCYAMFHETEVWCTTLEDGTVKLKAPSKQESREKVEAMLREIIGRLKLNYF